MGGIDKDYVHLYIKEFTIFTWHYFCLFSSPIHFGLIILRSMIVVKRPSSISLIPDFVAADVS
jgi:hypothetical protein